MIKEKLSTEHLENLLRHIGSLYDYANAHDVHPSVIAHLAQAYIILNQTIANEMIIPVTVVTTPEEYDLFIKEVLMSKTVPTNAFLK